VGTGLTSVLDTLEKLFSKAYLVAGFLPAGVFLAVSALLGYHASPAFRFWFSALSLTSVVGLVPIWLLLIIVAALLGFLLWTVNPWFREVLEGRHLPTASLKDYLVARRLAERDRLDQAVRDLGCELKQLRTDHTNPEAMHRAEARYARLRGEKALRFPEATSTMGATSMGNMSEIHRFYGEVRYGMDIDLFWPGLHKIIQKDEDFFPILQEAKTRLEFSVAMTLVLAALTLGWSTVLLFRGTSTLVFLVTFGAGVPVTWVFYWMSVRSYRAFAELLRSAVDLFRFDLLQVLHVPLPANSDEETRLWKDLTRQARANPVDTLWYRHD
jgi:hypothetical protein